MPPQAFLISASPRLVSSPSATSFNQPLHTSGNKWNVSKVTNMTGMFHIATSFNQPLDKWNVSNVTDMRDMFVYTESFNQPLHAPQAWYHHYSSEDEDEDY